MKVLFYAFKEDIMCFNHILLNAIDMKNNNIDSRIIVEGKATLVVKSMMKNDNNLFNKALELNLIEGVCKACSNQMGVLDFFENTSLKILDDLMGHPSLTPYIDDNFEIISL